MSATLATYQPIAPAIAAVIALPPAEICRALIAACPATEADVLADAIDTFLSHLDEDDDTDLATAVSRAVYNLTHRYGTDVAADELSAGRVMSRALAGVGPAEYEPQDDEEFARFDVAQWEADAQAERDWRILMVRLLAAVEGVLRRHASDWGMAA